MKRSILLLIISFAALCFSAAPARANLFGFTVNTLDMTYNSTGATTGNFTADLNPSSGGILFSRTSPLAATTLNPPLGSGDFHISMALTGIVNTPGFESANATGTWFLKDRVGDRITGNVTGQWTFPTGIGPRFVGSLDTVNWHNDSSDNDFDGDSPGFVSMSFGTSQPWAGGITQFTTGDAPWFDSASWGVTITGGSVNATVVPVPGAVLLGMLGLSVAGIKLRKSA